MMNTFTTLLGIETPMVQAPMGGAAGPHLTASVSNAGALGTLPLSGADADQARQRLRQVRQMTARPFAVNLNASKNQDARMDLCLEEGVPAFSLFWGQSPCLVARAKAGGAVVMQTVGSAKEACEAVDAGADVIVAQGWEAGGHVGGTVTTMALVPAVVDAVGSVPVIAAGGIADGRGMAAALALGAQGVWIGTRFLASDEAAIHPEYIARLLAADETATGYYESLFDIGWPDAPHRVLRNSTTKAWETAGRPENGARPGEGDIVASSSSGGDIQRYQCLTPGTDLRGDIEALSMWAGQSVGSVRRVLPAGDIVREILNEARRVALRLAEGADRQAAPAMLKEDTRR
ncbi:nitronate monooxygenase [Jannaschia faecimaris]|uniref:Nitronate monooxygenase n=1 Tax=Jannaschia faecimaris TaxID=1244108 RepID=A0A1H3U796_9RHOB|nr:nitronate monooxygenase [Jannaschia faecimaris]SDZ58262.1 nitronate monooxygenase [Jannaschia faecimaris]